MKLPFFASFIVFCLWLLSHLKRQRKIEKKLQDSFWEKEHAANHTRKQPLDDLDFITIPLDFLPVRTMKDDPQVMECMQTITHLSTCQIVNLTGHTNTDLKLRYGVANLELLSQYDQNYTVLARTLQKWATLLYDANYTEEAKSILEFAVSTKTDISTTYALLSKIYINRGESHKLESLLQIAEGLHSAMKPTIVRTLKESYPYND